MKKIIIAMAAIAAAFTMASCNKEQPVSPNENPTVGKSVITASIENDVTKTTLEGNDTDGYKVLWSAGDQLLVGDNGWCAMYTLDSSSADSSKGVFSWQGGFFYSDKEIYTAPVFEKGKEYSAMYPFDALNLDENEEPAGLTWRTEQTYSETDRYIPMYARTECAENGTADFSFTNLGGILRLTVKGSASIKSIRIEANEILSGTITRIDGEGVEGDEFIAYLLPVLEDNKNYIDLNCGNGVQLSEEGTDFYISVPCNYNWDSQTPSGYTGVIITLTDTEGRTCVKKLKNNNELVIARSKITTATFTASEWVLPGKFSVAEVKQVQFSSGNLTCDISGAKPKWSFFEHQNDCATGYDSNLISLFTWGYDANKSIVPDGEEYVNRTSGDLTQVEDWGSQIGDGRTWRTLTAAEWQYLFNNHSGKWVTVNGVNGYVIAPDVFAETLEDSYADDAALAADNLVFLPAAGGRDGSDVYNVGGLGYYWSSSALGELRAYRVDFDSDDVAPAEDDYRGYGYSVRLITESK